MSATSKAMAKWSDAYIAELLIEISNGPAGKAEASRLILREAASRLQAPAVAEGGWQPIETAPQDGTQVLAPCGYGFLDVLTYSDGAWRETSNLLRARHQPTVWQPLPAAPALRTGGSE